MEAMPTHNLEMAPFVHVLVHHILQCVCRTGVPLGPTSEQALESQHTLFDIFFHRSKLNYTEFPICRGVYRTLQHLLSGAITN